MRKSVYFMSLNDGSWFPMVVLQMRYCTADVQNRNCELETARLWRLGARTIVYRKCGRDYRQKKFGKG